MKKENRELLIRVIGTIDGLCYLADGAMADGLVTVLELLERILESEGEE